MQKTTNPECANLRPMLITESPRLILRQFRTADADAMNAVFGDAEVMRFGDGIKTAQWVRDWLANASAHFYQPWGFGPWAVVEKLLHETIGYCGLFYFPDIAGKAEVEIGYRLARRFWGCGYATEAARAVCDYAFNVSCLSRLIALIDPANTASINVAQKIGMHYERDVLLEGYSHPDHVYVTQKDC
jgi:[ribosomal protein S5]-alanine N-acetyltransferase